AIRYSSGPVYHLKTCLIFIDCQSASCIRLFLKDLGFLWQRHWRVEAGWSLHRLVRCRKQGEIYPGTSTPGMWIRSLKESNGVCNTPDRILQRYRNIYPGLTVS